VPAGAARTRSPPVRRPPCRVRQRAPAPRGATPRFPWSSGRARDACAGDQSGAPAREDTLARGRMSAPLAPGMRIVWMRHAGCGHGERTRIARRPAAPVAAPRGLGRGGERAECWAAAPRGDKRDGTEDRPLSPGAIGCGSRCRRASTCVVRQCGADSARTRFAPRGTSMGTADT
jgi:hypothetical protein